jgi:hypothetical protein
MKFNLFSLSSINNALALNQYNVLLNTTSTILQVMNTAVPLTKLFYIGAPYLKYPKETLVGQHKI